MQKQGYTVMLNNIILPVTPGKITIKTKGMNKTYSLVSGGEINVLNSPGLTDFEFDVMLPMHEGYSFARYADGFISPAWFLSYFADIISNKKPVMLRIIRTSYVSASLVKTVRKAMTIPYNQNIRVSVEPYTIKEDGTNGRDIVVAMKFKQYIDYGTKTVAVLEDGKMVSVISAQQVRETDNAPKMSTYTVQPGDTIITLWKLAKKYTGDASRYLEIAAANNISGAILEEGQVLKLPW